LHGKGYCATEQAVWRGLALVLAGNGLYQKHRAGMLSADSLASLKPWLLRGHGITRYLVDLPSLARYHWVKGESSSKGVRDGLEIRPDAKYREGRLSKCGFEA